MNSSREFLASEHRRRVLIAALRVYRRDFIKLKQNRRSAKN
jgi:hypothetical protein